MIKVGIRLEYCMLIRSIKTTPELRQLTSVFSAAFEEKYEVDDAYLDGLSANPSAFILGAFEQEKVVGGLVAFEMNPIHGAKELYIYDIAVHPDFQKQGIGKKLIEYLKLKSQERGIKMIFVEAESEDNGAVAFYRAIGGEEESVRHFNFSLL